MPLTKLQFQPGINKETTSYSNEGGWYDMDKVRFRAGYPEKIGGWTKLGIASFLGSCRALHPWRTKELNNYLGVGTSEKYYIEEGEGYYDITPIRRTTSAGDVTFAATSGSSVLSVTDIDHGAVAGDFVTYSGAVSLGGNITADVLNQEYKIETIVDEDTYTIRAREVATVAEITVDGQYTPTYVLADGSDTGNGGAAVVGAYQINVGLDTAIYGNGWGAGFWGRDAWGSAAEINSQIDTLRLWTHDNFGEDLVINVYNGGIYYWDASYTVTPLRERAVALTELAGANSPPSIAAKVIVSDVDRHVIAFGCDALDAPGVQDPLLIRFSDQENVVDWVPTAMNSAGDLVVGSGSRIITALETRQQILVYTDVSLHVMQYLGPPFTYGINKISENVTLASPNAVAAVEDRVYWMGKNEFYAYTGTVQKIPCSVRDYVFSDFNTQQEEKVFCSANTAFAEVWWFYPSSNSSVNDRYVVYNYEQGVWYYGTLSRTAWIDRGTTANPIAAGIDGYLYYHESGFDDGSTNPSTAINAYIESSQFDIGDGDRFSFVNRIIPDVTFRDSTAETPSVVFTMKARNYPGGNYLQSNNNTVSKTASVPVEQFTDQVFVRLRGRSMALRVESDGKGVGWRLGSPRMEIRADGRR